MVKPKISEHLIHIMEHDGITYYRFHEDNWMEVMGESIESSWPDEPKLEALFTRYESQQIQSKTD